jgi:hypothetical protein
MLVDTGANINLVSVDTARRLPNLVRLNTNHLVKVAFEELISSNEAIITDVKMGDETIKNGKFIICNVSHE